MNNSKSNKITFNTTINENIANNFREYCKSINIPMNVVLEIFMTQFAAGQYSIKLSKNNTDIEEI